MALVTLKKRAEFLRLRGGQRCSTPYFVLETKPRLSPLSTEAVGPRFGFTVTKALGGAVVRNKIRRRLKSAMAIAAEGRARADHDYVLIARAQAYERPFAELKKDLEQALQRVHHPPGRRKNSA